VATSGSLLEVAVRFAAPVIGVLLLIELGIGLINRAAPQIDAFYFSMPIKAVTALLVLALLLTHLADVVKQSVDDSRTLLPKLDSVLRNR
jgi:type III secretion protein T